MKELIEQIANLSSTIQNKFPFSPLKENRRPFLNCELLRATSAR